MRINYPCGTFWFRSYSKCRQSAMNRLLNVTALSDPPTPLHLGQFTQHKHTYVLAYPVQDALPSPHTARICAVYTFNYHLASNPTWQLRLLPRTLITRQDTTQEKTTQDTHLDSLEERILERGKAKQSEIKWPKLNYGTRQRPDPNQSIQPTHAHAHTRPRPPPSP